MNEKAYLGVDHVVIRTADAHLFELLSGALDLPVTWPLTRAPFATFGWIGVGNANLEIWAAADNADLPPDCSLPLIQQIALAPVELFASLSCLRATGLKCKAPRAFQSKRSDGEQRTNFTNSVIESLSSDRCCVFLCDWDAHAPIVPWNKGMNTRERKVREQAVLSACGGGSLGVVGLRQIAVSTQNLEVSTKNWAKLTQSEHSPFSLTGDIELHLSAVPRDAIDSLTFTVRDLSATASFLESSALLEVQRDCDVALARAATGGIALRFIQVR